jgi:hypothetical protein
MDEEPLDSPVAWLLDRELDVAAEVYGPEPLGLRTPLSALSDEEMLERFLSVNGFELHFE